MGTINQADKTKSVEPEKLGLMACTVYSVQCTVYSVQCTVYTEEGSRIERDFNANYKDVKVGILFLP